MKVLPPGGRALDVAVRWDFEAPGAPARASEGGAPRWHSLGPVAPWAFPSPCRPRGRSLRVGRRGVSKGSHGPALVQDALRPLLLSSSQWMFDCFVIEPRAGREQIRGLCPLLVPLPRPITLKQAPDTLVPLRNCSLVAPLELNVTSVVVTA